MSDNEKQEMKDKKPGNQIIKDLEVEDLNADSQNLEEKESKEESVDEKTNWKKEVFSYVKIIVIAALVAFFISHFIIVNATIPTSSMENTIMTKSRVVGFRFSYLFSEPQRGDIVIFKYPVDESQLFIKRVIGLPGETVEIKDGKIYIDGSDTPLEEDYLKEEWVTENDGYTFEVPEGCYLVLGDNRNVSQDARYWAELAVQTGLADNLDDAQSYTYVSGDKILAKAIFEYWPTPKLLTNQ